MKNRWKGSMIGGLLAGAVAVGGVVALAAATAGATTPSAPPSSEGVPNASRTITVQGEGKVTVKPDTANVQLGAQATGDSAAAALDIVNQKTAALIEALKTAGVAEDDITTSGLSVYPNYDRNSRVSGFTAANGVLVKVRDVAKAGPVIDAAAKAAGDNVTIGGIWFSVSDQEAVISEARKAAIENAKKRATEYATAAGATVGDVVQISEIGLQLPQPLLYERQVSADTAAGAMEATSIQPGTQDLSVTVTVVYLLG